MIQALVLQRCVRVIEVVSISPSMKNYLPPRVFRGKFLNDPAFRDRFEKKEVEVKLDEN